MCFYNDCDWYASIQEDKVGVATKDIKCDECHRLIKEGEWVRHIFMQEDEECRNNPESEYCEGGEEGDSCPPDCEHDYGETFDYDRCETCDQLIEAIHQHELDEGCREDESRPNLTELYEALVEGDGRAYLAKAETLFPGITGRLSERFLHAITREEW